MIEQIATLVGKRPVISYRPSHPADVPATWANVNRAGRLLDWKPRVMLAEGLQRTVAWYFENRDLALSLNLGEL